MFLRIDPALEVNLLLDDGSDLVPGTDIASVRGSAASILRAERTAPQLYAAHERHRHRHQSLRARD